MKYTTQQEVEIDVTFPCFFYYGLTSYKIFSETLAIEVVEKDDIGIKLVTMKNIIGLIAHKGIKITEEEFTISFAKTLSYLNNLNP